MCDVVAMPEFPYGGVYYRVSAPPRPDWARDYRSASQGGVTAFRHWLLWSAVERRPGADVWDAYDAQLDLAARHGIVTIVAEMLTSAPEWAFADHPDARLETRDGRRLESGQGASAATAGFPGLCLDHPDARGLAGSFLGRMAARFRGHAGLGGYDVWNECATYTDEHCFCPATTARFQEWLRIRYGTVERLEDAWCRYGLRDFSEVRAPRGRGAYPEVLDWLEFRVDNAQDLLRWRIETIRAADPEARVTAHGLGRMTSVAAMQAADDWRSAAQVDSFGFTWVAARHDGSSWRHYQAADLTRSASAGKPFWHSEAQGGPLWLQPQVVGRPASDGRVPTPAQVRVWFLQSLAAGARGLFFPRWRPLLTGPLFGAFAPNENDGAASDRTAAASAVAQWFAAPEQHELRASVPARGDVALVFVHEAQRFDHAQLDSDGGYEPAADAVYQGFFEAGYQPDWVTLDQIEAYAVAYLPYPIALSRATAARLIRWVHAGGTLISEAAPGYFDEHGVVQERTPGGSLLELFGVTEATTEFMPDLWSEAILEGDLGGTGALVRQSYRIRDDAVVLARYRDGAVAATVRDVGAGRAALLGTSLPLGARKSGAAPATVTTAILSHLGIEPRLPISDPVVTARLHESGSQRFLWLTNPSARARRVTVGLPAPEARLLRGDDDTLLESSPDGISCTVPAHDAVVMSVASET